MKFVWSWNKAVLNKNELGASSVHRSPGLERSACPQVFCLCFRSVCRLVDSRNQVIFVLMNAYLKLYVLHSLIYVWDRNPRPKTLRDRDLLKSARNKLSFDARTFCLAGNRRSVKTIKVKNKILITVIEQLAVSNSTVLIKPGTQLGKYWLKQRGWIN